MGIWLILPRCRNADHLRAVHTVWRSDSRLVCGSGRDQPDFPPMSSSGNWTAENNASDVRNLRGYFPRHDQHDFDMARAFLGDFVEVSATGQRWNDSISDFAGAAVTLTAASGAVATSINSGHCASGDDQRLEAFGELGSLEVPRISEPRPCGTTVPSCRMKLPHTYRSSRTDMHVGTRSSSTILFSSLERDVGPSPTIQDGRSAVVQVVAGGSHCRAVPAVRHDDVAGSHFSGDLDGTLGTQRSQPPARP
ncbi:hypothetical protein J2X01_002670 [Arthrobacter ginsengisoli]|uniref:GFO/IDH/MocA-like oxidoreductase domain-containing protein n=1 Tax=Arthrobacter ginsengisoli TaxID=1356565 RepID=A0ABU1UDW9_9MICC|nr:hypothetical protein [Arthrobacter ginsengisoli]